MAYDDALMEGIYQLSNRMLIALEADEIDTFVHLAHERASMIEHITQQERPEGKVREELAARFTGQFAVLMEAVEASRRRQEAQLQHIDRLRQAGNKYGAPGVREGLLNSNLCG